MTEYEANPLAVGTFCPTCGTRTSDFTTTHPDRVHPCPLGCEDKR